MNLYIVTAKISDVLEEGSLLHSETVNAEDIVEAIKEGASILNVKYDEVLSASLVKGG